MATVVSAATREWLAELLAEGWTAEVVSSRPIVHRYRLRLVDDLDEALLERVTPARIGVRARHGSSSLFFPFDTAGAARLFLELAVRAAEAA